MWIYMLLARDFSELGGWKTMNQLFSTESKAKAYINQANEPYDSNYPNYSYSRVWAE